MLNEILIKMIETRHAHLEHIFRSPSIQLDIISILGALQTWFHCGGCLCPMSIKLAQISIHLSFARMFCKFLIYLSLSR